MVRLTGYWLLAATGWSPVTGSCTVHLAVLHDRETASRAEACTVSDALRFAPSVLRTSHRQYRCDLSSMTGAVHLPLRFAARQLYSHSTLLQPIAATQQMVVISLSSVVRENVCTLEGRNTGTQEHEHEQGRSGVLPQKSLAGRPLTRQSEVGSRKMKVRRQKAEDGFTEGVQARTRCAM